MRSMRNAGHFVMMYRSLKDWEWYHDLSVRVLFLHLLLEVNWRPGKFEGVAILPGQVPTSTDKLANGCGLTRQTVRTALTKLQSTNVITIRSTKRFSVVTIVNWAEYQFVPDEPTNKATNRATSNQPPTNHQLTTIEEGKKERSKEVNTAPPSAVRELVWPNWAGLQTKAKWSEFVAYRKASHRFTYKSVQTEQSAINLLAKYYQNGKDCFAGLEEAMAKGWRFPVEPTAKIANGKATAMSREDAERTLADIRKQNGIEPGGIVETQLIPKDVLETLRRA